MYLSQLVAALKVARTLGPGQRLVVILPDSVRNYMSKFLNDEWMKRYGFMDAFMRRRESLRIEKWQGARISDLNLPKAVTAKETVSRLGMDDLCQLACADSLGWRVDVYQSVGFYRYSSIDTRAHLPISDDVRRGGQGDAGEGI